MPGGRVSDRARNPPVRARGPSARARCTRRRLCLKRPPCGPTLLSHLSGTEASPGAGGHRPARRGRCLSSDRKSTRLNSSHLVISYAVFCLKKKKKHTERNDVSKYVTVSTTTLWHHEYT